MGTQHKVLVVDDNKTYMKFVSLSLKHAGYDVVEADNIFISRLLREEKPDLILMDVEIGHTSGLTAVSAIKKRSLGNGMKILLHSSFEPAKLSVLSEEHGADGYIHKDGERSTLLNSVRSALIAPRLYS